MEIWAAYAGSQGAEGCCMLMGTVILQKESCVGSQWGVTWDSAGGVLLPYKLGALKINILSQGDQLMISTLF